MKKYSKFFILIVLSFISISCSKTNYTINDGKKNIKSIFNDNVIHVNIISTERGCKKDLFPNRSCTINNGNKYIVTHSASKRCYDIIIGPNKEKIIIPVPEKKKYPNHFCSFDLKAIPNTNSFFVYYRLNSFYKYDNKLLKQIKLYDIFKEDITSILGHVIYPFIQDVLPISSDKQYILASDYLVLKDREHYKTANLPKLKWLILQSICEQNGSLYTVGNYGPNPKKPIAFKISYDLSRLERVDIPINKHFRSIHTLQNNQLLLITTHLSHYHQDIERHILKVL